jgi:phospholipase C
LPVLSGLATGYAVCDRWFSSAPTQTFPNRWFAGAGTSQGYLHNVKRLVLTAPSIYGRLSAKGVDWAIYGYSSEPLTRHDFTDIQTADESHFGHFRDFQARAAAGTLPAYSFLEPSWGADGNSQHPNYDVAKGEQLIHDVYYAVRNGPGWNSTLLIITYDEHGGNFDHVPPPENATPPGDGTVGEHGFDFRRFGVRVPAVLVSPLIVKGTIFRAVGPIDHTSVLKTIQVRFQTARLTDRVDAAAPLGDVLTIEPSKARKDDPLVGVLVPESSGTHPNAATPSLIEEIHAERVAALPIRNHNGYYEHEEPVTGSTSELNNFIRDRTAAWKEHQRRQQLRRNHPPTWATRPPPPPPPPPPRKQGKTRVGHK